MGPISCSVSPRGQVSRLLFLETGIVGLISLVVGLGLGILASFGLSALTLSMFEMDVSGMLGLSFSLKAAGKTVLYFDLIFLLVMLFSGIQVSRAKLIDLIQSQRKNEVLKSRPLIASVAQFLLGVVCLGAAYAILLIFGMAIAVAVLPLCIPMLGLGTLGTLLIFRSLSGFVMKFVQKRPRIYYRGLNLFTLRQWLSKVHTTYLAQTMVCILLLLAIGITASSIGLNHTIAAATGNLAPYDLTIRNYSGDVTRIDFDAWMDEIGFDRSLLAQSVDVTVFYNDPDVTGTERAGGALALSDYNMLLAMRGQTPVELPPGETLLLEDIEPEETTNLTLGQNCVLVPDEMAEQLDIRRQVWAVNYAETRRK